MGNPGAGVRTHLTPDLTLADELVELLVGMQRGLDLHDCRQVLGFLS